jgi:cytochrome c-type biogenesis protein CcmH
MCIVSSYLKTFIENRIRKGESADTIVRKFENGFGDEILDDPVVLHFQKEGNQRMLDGLVNGFGPKIQAKPDSTWINLSLLAIGILGAIGIGIYLNGIRVRKKIPGNTGEQESGQNLPRNQDQTGSGKVVQTPTESKSADARKNLEDKYLKEI